MVLTELKAHQEVVAQVIEQLCPQIEQACHYIRTAIQEGNKVLVAGNGGSAADAQHIASELSGRFVKERKALPGIALTTDTSALTAIGNDYGFERIFARQVAAFALPGDLFIGISTSGNSKNILSALSEARSSGCITLGLSGNLGGQMSDLCDLNIVVPSTVTARIQEVHILIGHILCKAVDDLF